MENYCGKRLDGRYEIQEIIGVGGMAVVYKAYDNIDDRIVAVKILKEEFLAHDEFRRRFKNESKAIAVLSHPNIVKVYDVSFGDRLQYIVMEYIEGITLKEYIEQQKVIGWKETVHFVSQILKALQHAHDKGIIHRDVKPQNIMLLQDGTIKVTDFGIARFSRGDTKTMTENAIGSVHYISPEQARGELTDDKADIYSVGVVMYEMLTGQLPFQSDNAVSVAIMQMQQEAKRPREINPDIPLGLEQITLRAMQKNARDRYRSAAEMMLDLDEFRRDPAVKFDYGYFIDEEPTRYVHAKSSNGLGQRQVPDIKENAEADEEKPAGRTLPILLGIVAGLVVVVAVVAGILIGRDMKKVEVPNFIGKNYAEEIANNEDYKKNFQFQTENVYKIDVEPGIVIDQNPDASAQIRKGRTVKLQIAYNNESVVIQGIIGLASADAEAKLRKKGFSNIKIIPSYQKGVDAGVVFESYPTEGSYASKNETVTLYVSTDENPDGSRIPDVRDYSEDVARQLIERAGFEAHVTEADSDRPKGMVISQNPDSTKTAEGVTVIEIVVSTGQTPATAATVTFSMPNVANGGSANTIKVFLNGGLYATYNDQLFDGSTKSVEINGRDAGSRFTIQANDVTILTGRIDFTQSPPVISEVVESPYTMVLPSVTDKSVEAATDALKRAGFANIRVMDEDGETASSGTVKKQSPRAGDRYSSVTEVVLTVADEPAPPGPGE